MLIEGFQITASLRVTVLKPTLTRSYHDSFLLLTRIISPLHCLAMREQFCYAPSQLRKSSFLKCFLISASTSSGLWKIFETSCHRAFCLSITPKESLLPRLASCEETSVFLWILFDCGFACGSFFYYKFAIRKRSINVILKLFV